MKPANTTFLPASIGYGSTALISATPTTSSWHATYAAVWVLLGHQAGNLSS
jgi:hypothetical protein